MSTLRMFAIALGAGLAVGVNVYAFDMGAWGAVMLGGTVFVVVCLALVFTDEDL